MSENILFFILAIALSLLTQAPFVQGIVNYRVRQLKMTLFSLSQLSMIL